MKKTFIRVLAFALALVLAACAFASCGKKLSEIDSVRSENFTVTAGMLSYSLYDTYYYYLNSYGESGLKYYLGIDSTKPIQEQYYDAKNGVTWFDVFLEDALNGFVNALSLCEAALADGIELTDIDKKFIASEIDEVVSAAENDGKTFKEYVKEIYGKGVSEDDIRKTLETYRLANKKLYKDYETAEVTQAEIEAYAAKDPDYYLCRDIKYFTLSYSNETEKNPLIKEYAEKMKAAGSVEEFEALAADYKNQAFCVDKFPEDGSSAVKSAFYQNTTEDSKKTDLEKWVFAEDTVKGSAYLAESTTGCTVYIAVSDAQKNNSQTRDMYHILFSADVYGSLDNAKLLADDLYASWKEEGSSLEGFKTLANKYTTDYATSFTGGYYANVASGDLVPELDTWLFNGERAVGDSAVIATEYGIHMIYYGGEGEPYWKISVIQALKDEKAAALMEDYSELYDVEVIEDSIKYIK